MPDYRMTLSRDRLEEFKRNSAIIDSEVKRTFPISQDETAAYYNSQRPTSQFDSAPESTGAFFAKIEDIKWLIGKINENVTEIESLHTSSLSTINGNKTIECNKLLGSLVNETSKLNKEVRSSIKETETNNARLSVDTSDREMRVTQLNALKKKFVETIQRYQDIERAFEKKHRQRIERQILIVKPEATAEEIEMAIDSDQAPQIFAHSLLNSSRTGNASQVLDEVQTRHKDIKRIEKTIMELHNLFVDMQTMVELQQETIIHLEKVSEGVVHDLEKGTRHVAVTVTRAKITRKRKWFCFILFLLILVIIGISI
ncbi:t-SNARE, partial [Mucor mucedo]|uniref:t-SNARE n=1 Tax=Mucor mucedo TaxID=29922 RepID=UPI00221FB58A